MYFINLLKFLCILLACLYTNISFSQYRHEIFGYIDLSQGIGKISSNDQNKNLNETKSVTNLGYGYFINEFMEPFLELNVDLHHVKIGDYSSKKNFLGAGMGLLFNVPLLTRKKLLDKDNKDKGNTISPIMKFLPYGGFVINLRNTNSTGSQSTEEKVSNNTINSKIMFGVRYFISTNIAINSWIRVYFENSQDSITELTSSQKGSVSKIVIDLRLLSLSLLL